MVIKYLEVDSTFRNRNLWPLPASFELIISQSGQKSAIDAIDPVSLSSPIQSFTSNLFQADTINTPQLTGTVLALPGIGAANSQFVIVFQSPPGDLHFEKNYYKHAVIRDANDSTIFSRILEYKYLGNNKGHVKILSNLNLAPGSAITIDDPTDLTDLSNPLFFIPNGSNNQEDYLNKLLYNETLGQFRTIINYDNITGILSINTNPIIGWLPSHNYSIRQEIPNVTTTAVVGTTSSQIVLAAGSSVDGFYQGSFIRILSVVYNNNIPSPQNETRRIVSYDGATLTATVSPPFSSSPIGLSFEILRFSFDNFNPFTYTGSQQQENINYEIKLASLILPNQILSVGNGGQISFYRYVYVELSSLTAFSPNIIYSNNPNSTRMLFRASIENDFQRLEESAFINFEGDDMKQILSFNPYTNFKFSVTLSNGEIFNTMIEENHSPSKPNSAIQIAALFELTKLD